LGPAPAPELSGAGVLVRRLVAGRNARVRSAIDWPRRNDGREREDAVHLEQLVEVYEEEGGRLPEVASSFGVHSEAGVHFLALTQSTMALPVRSDLCRPNGSDTL
jgi:hypothetical protein